VIRCIHSTTNIKSIITIVRALKWAERARDEGLVGMMGSAIGEEGRIEGKKDDMRWRTVGLGCGAKKAMEKSVGLLGELGVTMIAGSGLFSSTKGRVRSSGAGMRM